MNLRKPARTLTLLGTKPTTTTPTPAADPTPVNPPRWGAAMRRLLAISYAIGVAVVVWFLITTPELYRGWIWDGVLFLVLPVFCLILLDTLYDYRRVVLYRRHLA